MKSFNRKIALVATNIFIILALLVIAELLTRLFYPEITLTGTSGNLIETNKFGKTHGLKPNSEGKSHGIIKKVNERGYWQYGDDKRKIAGKILFLGDSVTMGIGVESDSSFAGIIHNKMVAYEVLNPSLIAYTSQDYLNVVRYNLENPELHESIDKIYLFWCLNDVYPKHILSDAPGMPGDSFISSIARFLRENYKAYHLLKFVFSDRSKSYFYYDRQLYSTNNKNFVSAMNNIKEIIRLCFDHNIDFQMFLLPYEYQLRKSISSEFTPQQLVISELSNLPLNIYDCSLAFEYFDGRSEDLYLYGDGIHFSNAGHRLLASYLLGASGISRKDNR